MTDHADHVREAIRAYKFAQRHRYDSDLARELGIDRRTLNNWLLARYTSRPTARKLADRGIPCCPECGRIACPGTCPKKDEKSP